MSEIRVNYIRSEKNSISLSGITSFSGTGAFGLPGGVISKRPEVPKEGQIRYINGDIKKGLEYYNGTDWLTFDTLPDDYVLYGTPSLYLDFANTKSLVDKVSRQNLITFSRNSIGTYVGFDGTINTASANEARFDHDPVTGESLGLLVEEQRTNAFLNTNTFTGDSCSSGTSGAKTWFIDGGGTLTTNATTSPDGTNNATLAVINTANGYVCSNSAGAPTILQGNRICLSVFAKPHPSNTSYSFTLYQGGGSDYGVTFNLDPNGSSQTLTDGYSIKLSNGWYRVVINKNVTSGGAMILFWNNRTTDKYYIWGAQGENGAFPTSYIPATTAAVTRLADDASITGTNFSRWYNQSNSTFYTETKVDVTQSSGLVSQTIYQLGSGLKNVAGIEGARGWTMRTTSYGYELFDNYTRTGTHKMASYLEASSVGFTVDGRSITSATPSSAISSVSSLYIGYAPDGFGQYKPLSGHIKRLIYYPKRLTDTQLQQLTS